MSLSRKSATLWRPPIGAPRILFALFLGFLALAVQNSSWREATFLAGWNDALFDKVANLRRNTVGGYAPPVILINFGGAGRAQYDAKHAPAAASAATAPDAYPDFTPLDVIAQTMTAAERMKSRVAIVDIDISLFQSRRSAKEISDFRSFLDRWSSDPAAPLTIFVRTELPHQHGDPGPALEETPWDQTVSSSPNLVWGSSNGEASGADGTLRSQYYYTCVSSSQYNARSLPSAAIFAAAAAADPRRGLAKQTVAQAFAKGGFCTNANTQFRPGDAGFVPGQGFSFRIGDRLISSQSQRGLINYHLDDPNNPGARAGAPLPPGPWNNGARAITTWEVGDLLEAVGPQNGLGSIVVLGASQPLFPDLQWTPYREVMGSLVLANNARGIALSGPIADVSWYWQVAGLILMLLATHFFFRAMDKLRIAAHRSRRSILSWIARGVTSAPAAKVYAIILIYQSSLLAGAVLIGFGFWSTTPFIGASIYVLIGDAVEILEGDKLAPGD